MTTADNELKKLQDEISREEKSLLKIQAYYKTFLAEHEYISKSLAEIGSEMQELSDLYTKALRLHARGIINDQQLDRIKGRFENMGVAGKEVMELINSISAKGLQLLKEERELLVSIERKKILLKSIIDFQSEPDENSLPIC